MKLDQEPRLTGVSATLMEWARKVVQVVNGMVDSKAPLDSPNFTGSPTATTPASTDNSTRIATTAWAKFGFAVLLSSSGYIKFPAWLNGFVIQWATVSNNDVLGTGFSRHSWPMAFPNGSLANAMLPITSNAKSFEMGSANFFSASATQFEWVAYRNTNAPENRGIGWCSVFAIGIGY